MRLARSAAATAAAVALAVGVLATAPPAAATPTSYVSDACSSSGNKYCFRLHYNSRSSQTWVSHSSCFMANKSVPNAWGYSPNGGASVVRYVFGFFTSACYDGGGTGDAIYHKAASGSNDDPSHSYHVFSDTNYYGYSTYFPRKDGIAHNLESNVKNKNESQRRN
ncbi:hypothetical protein ACFWOX_33310 [Streptomyces sp. NPDC058467]|uniref:hypothetical protein n=1 Tax=unclassified Streptomyces TaxID=2593676 RepID=UPI0033FB4B02